MTSTDEKEKGAAAWANNDYALAITHFTSAIEIGGDKDFLKVVYSNRSVACLKVKKLSEAVADASKCIELDGNWAKGYTRKGDALYSSLKYTDAFNAYNSAKRLSPNDASLVEKCELAMRAIRNEADRSSGATDSGRAGPSTATATAPPRGIIGKIVTTSRYLSMLCAVLYLLPFGKLFSSICFRAVGALKIEICLLELYSRLGFLKFNLAYASRIVEDPSGIGAFLGVLLVMSRPYLFALAPVFLGEMFHMTTPIFQHLRTNAPMLEEKIKPMMSRFLPSTANQDISAMLTPSMETQFSSMLLQNAAVCEVMQGVFLIVELALPTRNPTTMFLWWQYLQMRFMMDKKGHIKTAFSSLDQRISMITSHRLCPKVVITGYNMLKKFLSDKVKPPQAPSGPAPTISSMFSDLKSKCSVM